MRAARNAGGTSPPKTAMSRSFCSIPKIRRTAKALISTYKRLAREEYGREIQVWAASYMVQGQTEKEARDFYKYYVHEKGDWEAVTNLVDTMGLSDAEF